VTALAESLANANPMRLDGFEFVAFASPENERLGRERRRLG